MHEAKNEAEVHKAKGEAEAVNVVKVVGEVKIAEKTKPVNKP